MKGIQPDLIRRRWQTFSPLALFLTIPSSAGATLPREEALFHLGNSANSPDGVPSQLSDAVTRLASRVIPAVVGIETRGLHPELREGDTPRDEITFGSGSGFLINSGGPLVDIRGQVIGIANAKVGLSGVGFAIPIDPVRELLPDLERFGEPSRGFIGVELEVGAGQGVQIRRLIDGAPALAAGLQPGDVIQQVNDQEVQTLLQLQRVISSFRAHETVTLKIRRGEDLLVKTITLAKRE
ncbi:MAG: PDZ domain-containing protein [Planctomycetota bacterium]